MVKRISRVARSKLWSDLKQLAEELDVSVNVKWNNKTQVIQQRYDELLNTLTPVDYGKRVLKSTIWHDVKGLSTQLEMPIDIKWKAPKLRMINHLRNLKAQQAMEQIHGRRYVIEATADLQLINGGVLKDQPLSYISKQPNGKPRNNAQVADAWGQKSDYGVLLVGDTLKIVSSRRLLSVDDALDLPMFGSNLVRPHLQTIKSIQDNRCVFNILADDHNITPEQVTKVTGREPRHGLTASELKKVADEFKLSLIVIDLQEKVIAETHYVTRDSSMNKQQHVYLMSDRHLYKLSDAQQKRIINRQANRASKASKPTGVKSDDKNIRVIFADSFDQAIKMVSRPLNEKALIAKAKKKHGLEVVRINASNQKYKQKRVSKKAARDKLNKSIEQIKRDCKAQKQEVKKMGKTIIYVSQPNLFDDIIGALRNGIAYRSDLNLTKAECTQVVIGKTVIHANPDYEALKKTAEELGITYVNQNITALAKEYFNLIDNDRWEQSSLNSETDRLIKSASQWHQEWNVKVPEDHTVHAIDLYRNYASCALKVQPQALDFMAEVEDADIESIEPNYWYSVETDQPVLFGGGGVFPASMVTRGLKDGLITFDDVKYRIKVQDVADNKPVLHDFVHGVYKISNDKHKKQLVNYMVGVLAGNVKESNKRETKTIVSSWEEASYYFHTARYNKRHIATIPAKEYDLPHDLYQVTSETQYKMVKSDRLIRNQIVYQGRLETYRLYKKVKAHVAKHGGHICQVATDCIKYTLPKGVKPLRADNNNKFGSTRNEKVRRQDFDIDIRVTDMPKPLTNGLDWKNIQASETEAFDVKELLKMDRALVVGHAGCGKTYLANKLIDQLSTNHKVLALSFTNTAARLLTGGVTFHSAFAMDIDGNVARPTALSKLFEEYGAIVIDEASMIPKTIYQILTTVPRHVKIFAFGDFNQYPPIEDDVRDYLDSSMLKGLLDYNRVILRKSYRSNPEYAKSCLTYREKCQEILDTVGNTREAFQRMNALPVPEGVRSCVDMEELPLVNITFTNTKRRELNGIIVKREAESRGVSPIPAEKRLWAYESPDDQERFTLEYINAGKLITILENTEDYKHLFGQNDKRDLDIKISMVHKLLANSLPHKGTTRVVKASFARSNVLFQGRQYAHGSISLQNMPRLIREVAADGKYLDIDMVNAHPTIYHHFCKTWGLEHVFISEYVNDREGVLAMLARKCKSNRKTMKTLVLEIINGSSLDYQVKKYKLKTSKFLEGLYGEVTRNTERIVDLDRVKYNQFINHLTESELEPERRPKHRFVNQYLCQTERKVLDLVIDELKNKRLCSDDYIPCFDGVMIRRTPKIDIAVQDGLLKKINYVVKKRYNIDMKFDIKPMGTHIIPESNRRYEDTPLFADGLRHQQTLKPDEFPYVFGGMNVIANQTVRRSDNIVYSKNQMGVITSDEGDLVIHIDITDGEHVTIPLVELQKNWRPAYAITSHKSQGQTFKRPYAIHEFERLSPSGKYVALTRTVNPSHVTIVV